MLHLPFFSYLLHALPLRLIPYSGNTRKKKNRKQNMWSDTFVLSICYLDNTAHLVAPFVKIQHHKLCGGGRVDCIRASIWLYYYPRGKHVIHGPPKQIRLWYLCIRNLGPVLRHLIYRRKGMAHTIAKKRNFRCFMLLMSTLWLKERAVYACIECKEHWLYQKSIAWRISCLWPSLLSLPQMKLRWRFE